MRLEFFTGELDRADVEQLLALHFATMRRISPPDACHVLPAEGLRDPAIHFWSAREGGRLLGIGALKLLGNGHGEVKSMRVADEARGRGVGRTLLDRIIAEARSRAVHRLSLETGNGSEFEAALALYRKSGFVPCGPFGDYRATPFTLFFTREI